MTSIVSIIIPTFNNATLIGETLDSLIDQISKQWECVVVDDGSSDTTRNIVLKYTQTYKQINYYDRPDHRPKGANACRNYGVEKSTGDYIIFLDGDDLLTPTCIENRLAHFKESPQVDGLVFSTQVVTFNLEKKKILNKDPEDITSMSEYVRMLLSYKIPWQITGPIWKKNVILGNNGFDETFYRFQDVEFHTRLLLNGLTIKRVAEVDFLYRQPPIDQSKYQDPQFVDRALKSIYQYIEKFNDFENEEVLSAIERKASLKKMLLRVYKKFVLKKQHRSLLPQFIKVAKETSLFTAKEIRQLKLLSTIIYNDWDKISGLGMHRLKKKLQRVLEI
jgi:glycosyltransferase involved in cell wall biosynthesis